jgi:hypothetical protein
MRRKIEISTKYSNRPLPILLYNDHEQWLQVHTGVEKIQCKCMKMSTLISNRSYCSRALKHIEEKHTII